MIAAHCAEAISAVLAQLQIIEGALQRCAAEAGDPAETELVLAERDTITSARRRLHARLLRSHTASRTATPPVQQLGGLVIDRARREARVNGEILALRPREFDLLAALGAEHGRVVPVGRLLSEVWGWDPNLRTRTVAAHAEQLRRKLAGGAGLVNVRGVGYRLDPVDERETRLEAVA